MRACVRARVCERERGREKDREIKLDRERGGGAKKIKGDGDR